MLKHTGKFGVYDNASSVPKPIPSFQAVLPDLRIDRKRIANMRRAQRELWQAIAQSHDAIRDTRKLLTEIETT